MGRSSSTNADLDYLVKEALETFGVRKLTHEVVKKSLECSPYFQKKELTKAAPSLFSRFLTN